MKTVFIAGATGYLGRYLLACYRARGWQVRALVRDKSRAKAMALPADELIEAQATDPASLLGKMEGCDLVVSCLGITRQQDGLSYHDVDYQANANLLEEALTSGVARFAYVHVLNADKMADVPLVAAKQAFVDVLRQAPIASTVIAPSGYFSDMMDFLKMAQAGRVWLFGPGNLQLNPIHGADLAEAIADTIAAEQDWLDIGGPDIFTHRQLAELAFAATGRAPRITHLPDCFRRLTLTLLPWLTPQRVHGPAQFFLTAMGSNMVGACHGTRHLAEHFRDLGAADRIKA